MIKKIIVTMFIFCLTNLTVLAEECVTGYACSINSLNQQNKLESEHKTELNKSDPVIKKEVLNAEDAKKDLMTDKKYTQNEVSDILKIKND